MIYTELKCISKLTVWICQYNHTNTRAHPKVYSITCCIALNCIPPCHISHGISPDYFHSCPLHCSLFFLSPKSLPKCPLSFLSPRQQSTEFFQPVLFSARSCLTSPMVSWLDSTPQTPLILPPRHLLGLTAATWEGWKKLFAGRATAVPADTQV